MIFQNGFLKQTEDPKETLEECLPSKDLVGLFEGLQSCSFNRTGRSVDRTMWETCKPEVKVASLVSPASAQTRE